jgi:hypothetical protein
MTANRVIRPLRSEWVIDGLESSGDLATDADASKRMPSASSPLRWLRSLVHYRWLLLAVVLVVLLLIGLVAGVTGVWIVVIAVAVAALIGATMLQQQAQGIAASGGAAEAVASLDPQKLGPAIAATPPRPAFALVETDPAIPTQAVAGTQVNTTTGGDVEFGERSPAHRGRRPYGGG